MRALLVSALATTLIGCQCVAPPQAALRECTDEKGFACFDGIAGGQWIDPKPAALKADPTIKNVRTTTIAKRDRPSSAQSSDKADPVTRKARRTIAAKTEETAPAQIDGKADAGRAKPSIAAKTDEGASAQISGSTDSVLKKAKATISAKMGDPSVEFGAVNRALRKNTLGQPIDTICGYIKGKGTSDGDTGEKPFLYLVQEDEAYVVDGNRDVIAATAYRNICN
jgi:hypothetical protein